MTFEEILDHAMAMLQRRGRLTYGTLKRQFQLDDAALDDLGIRLRRDNRVSVRYAEELNSTKSSGILQRTEAYPIVKTKKSDN
jgi:hypothetical protein